MLALSGPGFPQTPGSLVYSGTVHERQGATSFGPRIEGAQLTFTHEGGAPVFETFTEPNGRYSAALPYGRYHVVVRAVGFHTYSTRGGFVVSAPRGRGIFNVFMDRVPPEEDGTGYWIEPPERQDWRDQDDRPPSVSLIADRYDLVLGQSVRLKLAARDDKGLVGAWAGCLACPVQENAAPRVQVPGGERFASVEWPFTPPHAGTYTYWSNARDIAYGERHGEAHQASEGKGMAWIRIRVHPVGTPPESWLGEPSGGEPAGAAGASWMGK